MERGKFIVFEGLNGCGKESQIFNLARHIYKSGREKTIFLTREPNEFDANGKKARQMLAMDGNPYENGIAAVGYFALNRENHNEIFCPKLDIGTDVICDRYYDSNFAFQHAQGISYEKIAEANVHARIPDLTYIIDVTAEEAFRRKMGSDELKGRKFDSNIEFNNNVMQNYLELGDVLPKLLKDRSIVYINGMQSIENVWEQIKKVYEERFS